MNSYCFPLTNEHPVKSGFRPPDRPNHCGVDFGWNVDEGPVFPVLAAADGVVDRREFENPGGGNWLRICHADDERSVYMHLSEFLVELGQNVTAGQLIAKSGDTGGVPPHLHFELHSAPNTPVDPLPHLHWPGGAVFRASTSPAASLKVGHVAMPDLTEGASGHPVAVVQRLCGIASDEVFGPDTAKAVRDFQMSIGVIVNASVGAQTWTALIQRVVGASVDGVYGTDTTTRVATFQGTRNIPVDGIAGAKTFDSAAGF